MSPIREASRTDAKLHSDLAFRSKSHWNYSPEQLAVFRLELTLDPDQIRSKRTHLWEEFQKVEGFYTLVEQDPRCVELEHIFVEPRSLRRGIGRELFRHAVEVARRSEFETIEIQSDPNAAGFYVAMGAEFIRDVPSSIPGRSIPIFRFPI